MTFGDIAIFNEVSQYMELFNYTPESNEMSNYANILKWSNNLSSKNSFINEYNQKMK